MIKYLRERGNQNIFSWKKSDGGLNIYSKFIKIVIKGIWNFRRISDVTLVPMIAMEIVWIWLFKDIFV